MRVRQFFFPGWGKLTGIGVVTDTVKGLARDLRLKEGIVETFEEACARFKVDESGIKKVERTLLAEARIAGLLMLSAPFWCFYFSQDSFTGACSATAGFLLTFACWFANSFRLFQVRHRNLISVELFLNQPSWWLTCIKRG